MKTKAKKLKINGPTWLTILRMVLSVLFMVFVLIPEIWAKIVALAIFVAGSLTDKVDGEWARSKGLVTDLGAFLDPLADKMLTGLAFLVLVYLGAVPVWVFAIILVRDYAVDGMRMMAAREGVTIAASIYGKLKTTCQMVALTIILLTLIVEADALVVLGNIFLYVSLALSVFSGADYLIKGSKKVIK